MDTLKKLEGKFGQYVQIDGEKATVMFKFQDEPINEVGENGCQVHTLGEVWVSILKIFNRGDFRCRENSITITKIEEALMWQEARTKDRIERGVEGYNEP